MNLNFFMLLWNFNVYLFVELIEVHLCDHVVVEAVHRVVIHIFVSFSLKLRPKICCFFYFTFTALNSADKFSIEQQIFGLIKYIPENICIHEPFKGEVCFTVPQTLPNRHLWCLGMILALGPLGGNFPIWLKKGNKSKKCFRGKFDLGPKICCFFENFAIY